MAVVHTEVANGVWHCGRGKREAHARLFWHWESGLEGEAHEHFDF